jgi:hypothetical protein
LAHPGKGGPEKQSLERLKDLNKRRDTTVGIASLVGIDILDQKHDRTDRKIDVVSSTQTDILSQVTQVKLMFKEKTEDRTSPKSKKYVANSAKWGANERQEQLTQSKRAKTEIGSS